MRNIFNNISFFIFVLFVFLPNSVLSAPSDTKELVYDIFIGKIITPITGIIVSLIILYFFFNSAMYLFKVNKSQEEKKKIMQAIMWSVVILFLLVSIWGIVKMVAGTLSLETAI